MCLQSSASFTSPPTPCNKNAASRGASRLTPAASATVVAVAATPAPSVALQSRASQQAVQSQRSITPAPQSSLGSAAQFIQSRLSQQKSRQSQQAVTPAPSALALAAQLIQSRLSQRQPTAVGSTSVSQRGPTPFVAASTSTAATSATRQSNRSASAQPFSSSAVAASVASKASSRQSAAQATPASLSRAASFVASRQSNRTPAAFSSSAVAAPSATSSASRRSASAARQSGTPVIASQASVATQTSQLFASANLVSPNASRQSTRTQTPAASLAAPASAQSSRGVSRSQSLANFGSSQVSARTPSAAQASVSASRASARSNATAASAPRSSRATSARSSTAASRSSASASRNGNVEQAIINAAEPLEFPNATERIQAGEYEGLHLNKEEEAGICGLDKYQFNNDPNPEVIRKRLPNQKLVQEVAVRHLKPPTPANHGDLVIRERAQQLPIPPAVVLRQEGARAATPAQLIYRQEPPRPPTALPEQVIEIDGEPGPAPARKIVFEKLPDQPAKPQNILIEKWLPYAAQRRRVVFQRACAAQPPNMKNIVIEWEQGDVEIEQNCVDLGVQETDPEEYVRQYGCELKKACEIPDLCEKPPCPNQQPQEKLILEGDVDALKRVDLDAHGLGEYKRFIQ